MSRPSETDSGCFCCTGRSGSRRLSRPARDQRPEGKSLFPLPCNAPPPWCTSVAVRWVRGGQEARGGLLPCPWHCGCLLCQAPAPAVHNLPVQRNGVSSSPQTVSRSRSARCPSSDRAGSRETACLWPQPSLKSAAFTFPLFFFCVVHFIAQEKAPRDHVLSISALNYLLLFQTCDRIAKIELRRNKFQFWVLVLMWMVI